MKHLRPLFIALLVVLLPVLCRAADGGYGYPIPTPLAATILGTPPSLKPELPKVPFREMEFDLMPNMERPDLFFYDNGLRSMVAMQCKKAPMIFLIAGTGSSHKAPKLITLARAFYQAGFHVATLPSPTHPNFIISASHSHIPGDLTEDAGDLYFAMETIWYKLKDYMEVSDFYLSGYSLGGTQAAFVAKLDEERKKFNFRKVLMINPAVNLYNSISQIEGLLNEIPGGSSHMGEFFNNTMDKFSNYYERGQFVAINDEFLFRMYQDKVVTKEEAAGMIGIAFRIASSGMIFSSDVMTNGGYVVPKNRVLEPNDSLTDYFRVSLHLSFFQYFDEYFYPYFQKKRPGLTKEWLKHQQSLELIEDYLKSSPKFGVVTNENDFILKAGELDYLKMVFGNRAKIYPTGGHLGNLEYKDNLAYTVGFFK